MAEFDLCNVADYHDPVTRRAIKKGLSVCTTSQRLFDLLHGRKCRHDHEHQAIEGTTTYQGKRISRSRFTENYPRKFVRQIVQLWLRIGRSEVPFADMILASTIPEADGPALKRPRIRAAPPVAPRWIEPSDLPCLKRRKLDKQADATPLLLNELERVFQLIDEQTPRVGKVTHHCHEDIIQKIQKWFPEKKLILGVSCRGTDRLQPPPKELTPAEAPYRITLCSHRTNGKIFVTEQWEEWQHLAQRQLIRTSGCPSRLSITVFASIPEMGAQFRSQLAKRETAFRAFWEADNNAALRRALLRRSRPFRGQYAPGEWVMIWRQAEPPKGQWLGPMKVVTQESAQIIWCTRSGRLYRCSPEQVRPVSAYEAREIPKEESNLDVKPSIGDQLSELQRQNNQEQYQDLAGSSSDGIDTSAIPPINHSGNDPTSIQPINPESSTPVDVEHDSVVEPDNEPGASSEISDTGPTPENVPIPESEDESLHCTALICHDHDDPSPMELGENQVWQAEILVCQEDIDHWRQCDESTAASFLATTAKRQRVEVKVKDLQPEEKIEMDKAKQSEIANWLSTGTVEKMLRSQVPPSQVMRCRWILTWKPIDEETRLMSENPSKDRKAKARIVVLGFMDPSLDQLQRDSPTMSRLSRMLVLQMVASQRWNLMSFDIRTAFLQGQPQKDRLLAIEPVPELASAMKLQSHELCKLTKSAYGLVDAPFLWYQALKKQLIQLEFQESPFCPCTFVLRNPQTQETEGVLGIHVDDGIGAGNQRFQAKIAELEKVFPFGSKKMGKFTFTGIDIQQNADHSISMSQSLYVRNIKAIAIDPERRSKPEEVVTSSEQQDLRALVGSLQYASVHTRPDISSRLSYLQSTINKACVKDLIEGNKVLHETKKEHDLKITIQSIRCEDLRFLMFSDASFSSPKVPDSHAGNIILATHKDIASNCQCPISPLSWGCKKIQRVVVSTLAAETMAMTSALDQLSWLRLYWAWLLNPNCNWQQPEQALAKLPQSYATATFQSQQLPADLAVTDCKSLYDLVTRAAPPNCQEYRTMLHARSIKEMLQEGVQMRWVHSGAQLADALTKVMEGTFLRATLRAGHYKLHDELEVLKSRSNSRNRIRWLKSGECSDACCLQQF